MQNAICLVIDGLHAGYLGCYGNAWIATPVLDRLAATGFLFDQAFVDTPDLPRLYRSYWQGVHAMVPDDTGRAEPSLAARLAEKGIGTYLWSDEAELLAHPLADGFRQRLAFDLPREHTTAPSVEETHLARTLAAAVDRLSDLDEPFCLWIHLRGMYASWDAPLELRNQFVDEDEPEPGAFCDVPEEFLPEDFDPDELLGVRRAYAGQVSLLDTCLGGFIEALDEADLAERTLLTVLGARSFPLGEHRRIGPVEPALYEELAHVPWIMRLPNAIGAADRCQAIVGPADLGATLLEWFGAADGGTASWGTSLLDVIGGDASAVRQWTCLTGSRGEQAVRTPAWYLRCAAVEGDEHASELYAKPDDRWEVNEVSDRCGEEVEALQQALTAFEAAAGANRPGDLPALDEALLHPDR